MWRFPNVANARVYPKAPGQPWASNPSGRRELYGVFLDGLTSSRRRVSHKQFRSQLPEKSVPSDADHAWLTPVKANSDVVMIKALVDMGVVDDEFVADVLAVDFTEPLFSA